MSETDVTTSPAKSVTPQAGLGLAALTAIVVGSMIGSGIFALRSQMAASAAPGPLFVGWAITGVEMLMLAFVVQALAERKPEVKAAFTAMPRPVSATTSDSRRPSSTGHL